jgi:hypothetical protein
LLCRRVGYDISLNNERGRWTSNRAPYDNSQHQHSNHYQKIFRPVRATKFWTAILTKPSVRPDTPAQAKDLVAAFGAKIWAVKREE